jgi:ubiquinone/menaquinone biosynthesis C-methylase UbiE
MVQPQIRYDDGAAYERMMGAWSRIAGEIFLDWLAPPPGLQWIDVGCGSGAFTELLSCNDVRQPKFIRALFAV